MPDTAAKTTVEAGQLLSLVNSLALERISNGETETLPAYMPRALDVAGSDRALMVHQSLGARVLDSAGTSYVDLCMGHGALMLGHGAAPIKTALHRQLELGWMHGFSHLVGEQLAQLIHDAAPGNERVIVCGSESDATLLALRAARAYRGRERIALFSGSTHGLHDIALVTTAPSHFGALRNAHIGAGIPAVVDDGVLTLPYASDKALETIGQHRDTLAAVIVEPVCAQQPSLENGAWLTRLNAVCQRNGVPLILDETLSGFRIGYGGAQVHFGLRPDLVVYGNALGGGLPIGAVAGRSEIMSVFGGGFPQQRIFCGTTHAGNPLSAAAAEAVLNVLAAHREAIYPQLHQASTELAASFNSAAEALGIAAHIYAAGSMFRIVFGDTVGEDTVVKRLQQDPRHREGVFYRNLFQRRVVVHQSKRCFLSTAHTVADIAEVSTAFIQSLEAAAR